MTSPQKKSDQISKTCLQYLKEWYLKDKYDISTEIKSKYLEKGIACEELSIALMSIIDDCVYTKNDEFFENEWLTGTPDIITDNEVIDIKTSWSIQTFPFGETDYDKAYMYQLMGYMDLTGKNVARLAYCLINTPEHLIQDEIRRFCWNNNILDCPAELEAEIRSNFVYDKIPVEQRVKIFEIRRDDSIISEIHQKVELCRNYINTNLNF